MDLRSCPKITGKTVSYISKLFEKAAKNIEIISLGFRDIKILDDKSMDPLVKILPKLIQLKKINI